DQQERFAASGWATMSVDGHDPEAIASAIEAARSSDRPTLIACRTTIGYGAPRKAGSSGVHGSALGEEEIRGAGAKLNWPHEPFEIPEGILKEWRQAGRRGASVRQAWQERFESAQAGLQATFERRLRGELPGDFDRAIRDYKAELAASRPNVATRK